MSNCSDCYGNCSEIISDRCVKYTGVDVSVLGIQNGDSLSFVEQALATFLTSTLDGSGIVPIISEDDICALVDGYLADCEDITLNNILTALLKATCNLQTQITAITTQLTTLEGNYTIGCLTGVTASSGTHAILQAVITKLCANEVTLTTLALDVATNYVALDDLNGLIQDYLDTIATTTMMYNRMIPYVAVEYYGPLTYFDATGKGTGTWDKIYLCNGMNGTPDKRGRVGVGCTNMLGTVALDAVVDPSNPNNPAYSLASPGVSTKGGANVITLTTAQLPVHSHANTAIATAAPHTHHIAAGGTGASLLTGTNYLKASDINGALTTTDYILVGHTTVPYLGLTEPITESVIVTMTNANTGSGSSHSNIQPVLATYYIIYIP